jgi:mannosylglycoprotein endo-beta-mannosidase
VLTSHEEKEENIFDFYNSLLGEAPDRDETINLEALAIPQHDLSELEAPFSEEEVWQTICLLPPDKAPGPDGFTGKFYKACWPVIKVDVMAAVSAIWCRRFGNFEQLNSAYITLLPKKAEAMNIKDYRPISLVHSFAKLITKILANRLARRLNELVSPIQSAFIKGRFIQDNFMFVQQTARYLHQQKQARILLKLDITKAFDSVSWPFLLEVMRNLGFGQIWCDIISGLLAASSTQVMLNGSPGEKINYKRGLRQGDPLSPMLFILVMDVLGFMIKKAVEEDLLQPLARRALQHRISIYADDVVIFLRPSADDIDIILDMLHLFGRASGLKTNVDKSSVLPIQCLEEDRRILQAHLPCQLLEFPCKYLGVPLSLKKLTRAQIQPIIDKVADQLPGWKADLLTRAGRKVLVQFVLTSMLIYLSMAMDLPPWAIKVIDKIRRGFLWKGRRDVKGGHCLVAWPRVTRPPELGAWYITVATIRVGPQNEMALVTEN